MKERWRDIVQNKQCACCNEYSLPKGSIFEICKICDWQDDGLQNDSPDYEGGANKMSLDQAKIAYRRGKKDIRIEQYDRVRLKDGREGDIMEVLGDQEVFIITIGEGPKDWEDIDVSIDEIEKIFVK